MKAFDLIKKFGRQIWCAVTPVGLKCIACGREIFDRSEGVCDECAKGLSILNDGFCYKCGCKVFGEGDYCETCGKNQHSFTQVRSVCEFDELARKLVHRLKFGGQKYLSYHMAYMMSQILANQNWQVDCLVAVPMTPKDIKKRGYNQARLLADELCDILSLPVCDCVQKLRQTGEQATLNYAQRMINLKGAYGLVDGADIAGKSVLLVDDVKTTGATLSELSKILQDNGASEVYGLTFASRTQKTDFVLEKR